MQGVLFDLKGHHPVRPRAGTTSRRHPKGLSVGRFDLQSGKQPALPTQGHATTVANPSSLRSGRCEALRAGIQGSIGDRMEIPRTWSGLFPGGTADVLSNPIFESDFSGRC